MRQYKVVAQCYVPVGPGYRYKMPGQIVSLDDEDAAELEGYITPVEGVQLLNTPAKTKGVQQLNTPAKAKKDKSAAKEAEEVSDAGEPDAAAQRDSAEGVA